MLMSLLADAGLTPEVCANLLGVDPVRFTSWANGERDMPGFIVPELSSVLGVTQADLLKGQLLKAPAIWYKFRGDKLVDADRELVVLIRRLGFYIHQLNIVTGVQAEKWNADFTHIRKQLEQHKLASPSIQGEAAANSFRNLVDLGYTRQTKDAEISGPGDVIRGMLRALGILIIEMPVPDSEVDGCSFYIGEAGSETPCLFVNTYRQGWFRRNYILAHELAHAIFDIDGEAALIDYRGVSGELPLKEVRADAFAKALFASEKSLSVLKAKLGFNWDCLSVRDLALIVAHTQVELRVVLRSAVELALITQDQAIAYSKLSLKKELRSITNRVLTPKEYFALHPERSIWTEDVRTTTIPTRQLRLPVPYIIYVIWAVNEGLISDGRAAEMLMMDYEVFIDRFGSLVVEIAA